MQAPETTRQCSDSEPTELAILVKLVIVQHLSVNADPAGNEARAGLPMGHKSNKPGTL